MQRRNVLCFFGVGPIALPAAVAGIEAPATSREVGCLSGAADQIIAALAHLRSLRRFQVSFDSMTLEVHVSPAVSGRPPLPSIGGADA